MAQEISKPKIMRKSFSFCSAPLIMFSLASCAGTSKIISVLQRWNHLLLSRGDFPLHPASQEKAHRLGEMQNSPGLRASSCKRRLPVMLQWGAEGCLTGKMVYGPVRCRILPSSGQATTNSGCNKTCSRRAGHCGNKCPVRCRLPFLNNKRK